MPIISFTLGDGTLTTLTPSAVSAIVVSGASYMVTAQPAQSCQVRIVDNASPTPYDSGWVAGPLTYSWVNVTVDILVNVLVEYIPVDSETVDGVTLARYYAGETIPVLNSSGAAGTEDDTFFPDALIGGLVTEFHGNILRTVSRMWYMKASEFARLIDIDEAGSVRKLTQRYKQALQLSEAFEAAAQLQDSQVTGSVRIAGKAINLTGGSPSEFLVQGEYFNSGLDVVVDDFYPSGVGVGGSATGF